MNTKIVKYVGWFVFGFVVGGVVLLRPHSTEFREVPVEVPAPYEVIKTDTVVKVLTEYVSNTDTIIKIISSSDTIKITQYVNAYFDTLFYSDTIDTKDFTAIIQDTVTQNRITDRSFKYKATPLNELNYFVGIDLSYPLNAQLVGGYQDQKAIYKIGVAPNQFTVGYYRKF